MMVKQIRLRAFLWVPATVLSLSGCGAGAGAAATHAVVNTAIAAAASGVRRSQGDCYTPCDNGYVCNRESGLCERLDCPEGCGTDEVCVGRLGSARCVPSHLVRGGNDVEALQEEQRRMDAEEWEVDEHEESWPE